MKRILKFVGSLLGLLALAALVIALTTTFRNLKGESQPASSLSQSPIQTPTQPPYPPPATSTPSGPSATPTTAPMQVPLCAFASRKVPVEPAPPLDAYQFSNPKVVLTNKYGMTIQGWAADNNRLLVVRNGVPQKLDVFDSRTGEVTTYAEREQDGPAFWLRDRRNKKEVVAYMVRKTVVDQQGVSRFQHEVWMSQEPGKRSQHLFTFPQKRWTLASTIESGTAIDPATDSLILFNGVKTQKPDFSPVVSQVFQTISLPADPFAWHSAEDDGRPSRPSPLSAANQPGGEFVAVYGYPHLFLYDVNAHQPCVVDLGRPPGEGGSNYPLSLAWSPDGRFLAMIVTSDDPRELLHYSHLEVLDTTQGMIHRIDLPARIVTEMAWAPNSRQILILGQVAISHTGLSVEKLYLSDALSDAYRTVLPDWSLAGGGPWGTNMAWSPDGNLLAIACPSVGDQDEELVSYQICLTQSRIP